MSSAVVPPPSALATRVELYSGESEEWDAFVRGTPGGTFFHLIGWRDVLANAFGFGPYYLAARRGEQMVGVLPLCEVRTPLRRCRLLSLPFTVQGGVCALDRDARRALEQRAIELVTARNAASVELRDGLDGGGFSTHNGGYVRFQRPVYATDEENLAVMNPKQRRMVRVGQRSGLMARVGADDLRAFYDLFARSMRRLGTPVFPQRYFRLLVDRFGDDCVLLTVRRHGTPVAASLSFFFGDTVLPYYAGSRREFFHYAINDFMYWELMRYARQRGVHVFDFGRSRLGTGAYEFKCHWGCAPEPLRYRVHATPNHLQTANGGDAAVKLLRSAWQRLPLRVTRLLGPTLVRHLGVYYT